MRFKIYLDIKGFPDPSSFTTPPAAQSAAGGYRVVDFTFPARRCRGAGSNSDLVQFSNPSHRSGED